LASLGRGAAPAAAGWTPLPHRDAAAPLKTTGKYELKQVIDLVANLTFDENFSKKIAKRLKKSGLDS